MAYNVSAVANSTGMLQFVQRVNSELMDNWLGILILIMIFTITLIATITVTNSGAKGFATASFISFGIALLLRVMDMVTTLAVVVTVVLAAGSVAMLKSQ